MVKPPAYRMPSLAASCRPSPSGVGRERRVIPSFDSRSVMPTVVGMTGVVTTIRCLREVVTGAAARVVTTSLNLAWLQRVRHVVTTRARPSGRATGPSPERARRAGKAVAAHSEKRSRVQRIDPFRGSVPPRSTNLAGWPCLSPSVTGVLAPSESLLTGLSASPGCRPGASHAYPIPSSRSWNAWRWLPCPSWVSGPSWGPPPLAVRGAVGVPWVGLAFPGGLCRRLLGPSCGAVPMPRDPCPGPSYGSVAVPGPDRFACGVLSE